ncbi:isopenicillin N synthase-like dioxygenase [Modestobacter roseus]|uniref:Isopenicillin N synthase-like dioxygenase n=2 Tax=Modestobacter roseus TaxID=1181884 RepID=A0A562IXN3_9ACTN|nr:2-oxoglutarate and iron-dependent oxygenase domain-containing protein [Modestobacter roseus]TWH75652.1 isopenicillin N synthase-like dioxygenase [Modestobacter roseus]
MTATPDIPLIDVGRWRTGDSAARAELAARLDRAMQDSGFFLVSGHGIAPELRDRLRTAAREFFALPGVAKEPYRCAPGGRGWIAKGMEANAFYGEVPDAARADLKESFTSGRVHRTGDPHLDAEWFPANVWPEQVPELAALCAEYTAATWELFTDLLQMCAVALGLEPTWFTDRSADAPFTFNINRYPSLADSGTPLPGQYRVGPHTDWGILTILDRQPGYGGLQVQGLDGEWSDAPFVPDAFTVNIADLLARWTGDRWRSTRHRVLPPSADAPREELISLIMFFETDVTSVVEPFEPPVGGGAWYEPVTAADYLLERERAATVA